RTRPGGNRYAARRANRRDPAVGDEDVRVFENFVALHRDDADAAEEPRAPGYLPRHGESDRDRLGLRHAGLLDFLLLLVFLFGGLLGGRAGLRRSLFLRLVLGLLPFGARELDRTREREPV